MSGAFDVVAARRAAAGVGVMALDRCDQHALAVVEDRREDVVVGQVAAAVVGVVRDQHVAVEEAVLAEELDGEAHRQRGREHELRDADGQRGELPARVEDRGVALVRLVQDRRRGGEAHVRRHLVADGLERPEDDLAGDRVGGLAPASVAGRDRTLHLAGSNRAQRLRGHTVGYTESRRADKARTGEVRGCRLTRSCGTAVRSSGRRRHGRRPSSERECAPQRRRAPRGPARDSTRTAKSPRPRAPKASSSVASSPT